MVPAHCDVGSACTSAGRLRASGDNFNKWEVMARGMAIECWVE